MHRLVRTVNSFQGAFATVQQFFALMKISFSKGEQRGDGEGERGARRQEARRSTGDFNQRLLAQQATCGTENEYELPQQPRRCLSIKCQSHAPHLANVCCHCLVGTRGAGRAKGRGRVVGDWGLLLSLE